MDNIENDLNSVVGPILFLSNFLLTRRYVRNKVSAGLQKFAYRL
jgi:hypothetical protein